MNLVTHALTPMKHELGIRSLLRVGTVVAARVLTVLYPQVIIIRLALKLFRGEPAISRFDWPFTPTHTSSKEFLTSPGSVLQCILLHLQPGHG